MQIHYISVYLDQPQLLNGDRRGAYLHLIKETAEFLAKKTKPGLVYTSFENIALIYNTDIVNEYNDKDFNHFCEDLMEDKEIKCLAAAFFNRYSSLLLNYYDICLFQQQNMPHTSLNFLKLKEKRNKKTFELLQNVDEGKDWCLLRHMGCGTTLYRSKVYHDCYVETSAPPSKISNLEDVLKGEEPVYVS